VSSFGGVSLKVVERWLSVPYLLVSVLICSLDLEVWVWESCDAWVWVCREVFASGGGSVRVESLKQGCPTVDLTAPVVMRLVVGCSVWDGSWKA